MSWFSLISQICVNSLLLEEFYHLISWLHFSRFEYIFYFTLQNTEFHLESKSYFYYHLFIFQRYLQASTEIRVLLYETIQKHTIKECWSQEPCKLTKGWGKKEILPPFYRWETKAPRIFQHNSAQQY